MNLDSAPSHEPVTLDQPRIPLSRARRLAEMGLRAGSTVTPLHRTAGGGRVVGVGVARVAVARTVLSKLALHGSGGPLTPPRMDAAGATATLVAPVPAPRRPLPPTVRSCHSDGGGRAPQGIPIVALAGTPNVGKSTLFNALTGARRQVGNWPGTTVEVGQGTWKIPDKPLALIDLPGTYSLDPISPDEELTRALLVDAPPAERPDLVIVVVNAADAARGLYLLSQVREQGLRAVVALTMSDVAGRRGVSVDPTALGLALDVPVVPLDPRRRRGIDALGPTVVRSLEDPPPAPLNHRAPGEDALAGDAPGGDALAGDAPGGDAPGGDAPGGDAPGGDAPGGDALAGDGTGAGAGELDEWALAEARFDWVNVAVEAGAQGRGKERRTWSDRIDRVVTSPVIGPLLFLAVMWAVFQITTVGAAPLVDGLDRLFSGPVTDAAANGLARIGLDDTWVAGLLLDGLITGVGMVLTFVPLMALMFVLLALLEDSGYLSRAAVVADRLMRAVGLPGRAFVPLVVGFGCNVPAIAATRVLPDARHRLLTALVVPFASCSARLPVYVLVGAAIFGEDAGNVVFGMYVASIALIILGGLLLRATLLRGVRQEPLVLDLPGYQLPLPRMLAQVTWSRLAAFLRTATGIIVLTVTAVWLLSAVPARSDAGGFGEVAVEDSAFAAMSSAAAPIFAPAGFGDWHSAGALVIGFVAKEAVVSSWAQTYATDEPDTLGEPSRLAQAVEGDFNKSSGGHPRLAGLAFLLFVLGYAPCVATMTAQVREIGLRWTLTGIGLSLTLSWLVAVAVFQIGRLFL